MNLFAVYRQVTIRDDEVIQGVLLPEVDPGDPRVRAALDGWEGTHFLHQTPHGLEVMLIRRRVPPRIERWWLHFLLGFVTLFSTTVAGAYFVGRDPVRVVALYVGSFGIPIPVALSLPDLLPGLIFSIPLILVLFAHEMGHYLMGRRHRMDISPPYFIPSPSWLNLIGTFGAFIRIRSPILNKVMLLDVGAAGPLMSFVASLPALALGLIWSQPVGPLSLEAPGRYVVLLGAQPIWLGDSILVHLFAWIFSPGDAITLLHPLAFVGWLGLFVTALNLFPLAQLDGGHILYALVGDHQRWAGLAFLAFLIVLGYWWWGWWFWAVVILVVGRGNTRHPPVFDPIMSIGRARGLAGWACVVIFVLTFVAIPLQG